MRVLSSAVVAVEIEARDACHWLLAAGFPQYVQLYEGVLRSSIVDVGYIYSCLQVVIQCVV